MGDGFGIYTTLARETGRKIVQEASNDSSGSTSQSSLEEFLYSPSYSGLPDILSEPMSKFAHNFSTAYTALLTQRQAMGHALTNSATAAEMTDLAIAKGFHTINGLIPQPEAAPS